MSTLEDLETGNVQALIDDGSAWRLEGSVGRACMAAIEAGEAMLGPRPVRDFYGNVVPAWWMVQPGSEGSPEYAGLDRPEEPSKEEQYQLAARIGLVKRDSGS